MSHFTSKNGDAPETKEMIFFQNFVIQTEAEKKKHKIGFVKKGNIDSPW